MDAYFRKSHTLKTGEKDINVVRANSPRPAPISRSASVEPPSRGSAAAAAASSAEAKRPVGEKLARHKDVQAVSKCVEDVKSSVANLRSSVDANHNEVKKQVEELNKQISVVKQETEQTKSERLKQKLDSFINSYNDNEVAHSNSLKNIEKNIDAVAERLAKVEDLLYDE